MARDINDKLMDGPIPGENYTADTKNYAWHRPPQFTNMDDAIEYSIKKIFDEEHSDAFVIMLQVGWSIVDMLRCLSWAVLVKDFGPSTWAFLCLVLLLTF